MPVKESEFYLQKVASVCEYCGKPAAFRSHRKHYFEFLFTRITGKVPFRCTRCRHRFWHMIDPRDI